MKRQLIVELLKAKRPDLANAVAYRIVSETTPLPKRFHENEPGLLTLDEFLQTRNPDRKFHGEQSYETTVERMNRDLGLAWIGDVEDYRVLGNKRGYLIEQDGQVVGVVNNNTLYHAKDTRLPGYVWNRGKHHDLEIKNKKVVKYPAEYVGLVSDVARDNLKRYPYLLQNLRSKGEAFQLRASQKPVTDKGTSLAILNSAALEVGSATDEWGATLIRVASEYQRRGFGKLLAQHWYRFNPSYLSGGFTPQGERNAIQTWKDRVHEFLSRGWYSQLVRQRRLSPQRVKDILKHAGQSIRYQADEPTAPPKPQPLYMMEFPTFVIYDRAFYDEPDAKHIYGFGFYRDNEHVGSYPFRIEYDRKYAQQTTALALHIAKQNGIDEIYIGKGYGDLIEWKGLTELVPGDPNYIASKRFPMFDKAARIERSIRRKLDRYGESEALLLDMAESKW